MKIDPDSLYVAAEVSEFLRCKKTNVYDLMKRGDMATVKIGAGQKGLRVKGSDLLAFVESRREGGPAYRPDLKKLISRAR